MVTRTHGQRQGTRSILKKSKRDKGRVFINRVMYPYAEGDRVAVEISGEAIHASGETYNNQYHFLLRIQDGKILELKEYMDTQLAAKILLGE